MQETIVGGQSSDLLGGRFHDFWMTMTNYTEREKWMNKVDIISMSRQKSQNWNQNKKTEFYVNLRLRNICFKTRPSYPVIVLLLNIVKIEM